MKRLLTAAALALSVTSAHTTQQFRSGSWTTYKTTALEDGTPICGMQVSGGDRKLFVKYQAVGEGNSIVVQMYKYSWRFGDTKAEVPLVLGFDKNEMLKATGGTDGGKVSGVFFFIKGDLVGDFLHEFGEADKMWIKFDAGNEAPWVADMTGSRNAMKAFSTCVVSLPKPTQPFASQQPTQPTQPSAAKKDDGAI